MAGRLEDDDWTPPSAADMKIIEARQERSNQISKLMGEYMLKGYRMLDRVCHCGTILLQNRDGVDCCVACKELETECAKDDPVLSPEAARVAVLEGNPAIQNPQQQINRLNFYETAASSQRSNESQRMQQAHGDEAHMPEKVDPDVQGKGISSVPDILRSQIELAGKELERCGSIETKILLCNFIKAASEALLTVLHNCEEN